MSERSNKQKMKYLRPLGAFGVRALFRLVLVAVIGALCLGSAAYAGTVSLPQTGQTTSYDTNTPQWDDGALRIGVAWPDPRFTVNNDQTVTDTLTGLVWTKDAGTPTVGSCTGGTKTWQAALDYVACLNTANYLGYNDWRLPNVNELESLTNAGQGNIASWLYYQGFVNVQSSYYWSSTSYASNTSYAWIVYMVGGYVYAYGKSNSSFVWPVRSGQSGAFGNSAIWQTGQITSYAAGDDGALKKGVAWPAPRFTTNGTQMVNDTLTGLVWIRDAGTPTVGSCTGGAKTWQAAMDYVKCLNNASYLGYSDWRLPNKKELMSLVDRGAYSPSVPSGSLFSNVQSINYWSSTSYANGTSYAWIVSLFDGGVSAYDKSFGSYVWPVRSGQVDNLVNLVISKSGTGSGTVTASTGALSWSGNTGTAFYSNGTSVTLTATANSGSTFAGWSGDCTGSSSTCTVMMSSAKNMTATFNVQSCSYTLTPTSNNVASSGGSGSVSVTANTGCTWTASSNASWIIISSGSSGSGNGSVGYTVAANTATTQRTGTMTIAGQTFTVTQGGITCTYTLTPTSKNFPSTGGTDSVSVAANTGCTWTASSNVAWMTINAGSSGSGNGTVSYTVAANTATTQRTGTMTIAGQTFTVTQGLDSPSKKIRNLVVTRG